MHNLDKEMGQIYDTKFYVGLRVSDVPDDDFRTFSRICQNFK